VEWTFQGSREHGGTWPGLQGWTINHRRFCVPPPSPWAGGSILFYICHSCHFHTMLRIQNYIKPYVVLPRVPLLRLRF